MRSVSRRWYAVLVLGSASFTLVGSLVPFEFVGRPWGDAARAFAAAMVDRLGIESRSDVIANVMLGVPLGFGLMGLLFADRGTPTDRAAGIGAALLPACCAFAAGVEFLQLYVPTRTCSGSDVVAQTVGSALGMTAWLVAGQRLTDEVRRATSGGGTAGRFLVAAVVLLGFIQALPLDLTLSPGSIYHKLRDGGLRLVPFGEFGEFSPEKSWDRAAGLIKLVGLYLPVGLLAGLVPGRFWRIENAGQVIMAAVALPVAIESAQVLVMSRVTSATDALVGALSLLAGWRLAQEPWSIVMGRAAAVVWFAAMAVASWQPLTFTGPAQAFDWVLGMPLEGGNPLNALEEMLIKLVLFGIEGVMCARFLRGGTGTLRLWGASACGLFTSAVFEAVQVVTPNHTPCVTDVLLGGFGAFDGAWILSRLDREELPR